MDENTTSGVGPDAAGTEGEGDAGRFGRARQFVDDASGAFKEQYRTVREKVDEVDVAAMADQARAFVRSNPGKALLFSVGIGFVIGMLLRRDDED